MKNNLKSLLKESGIIPKKSLGQNFILDLNFLNYMAELIRSHYNSGDIILEIGSGPGNLTRLLARFCSLVLGIEIDKKLFSFSQNHLSKTDNIKLLNLDIMDEKKDSINKKVLTDINSCINNSELIIVGNLPYYISSRIIIALLENQLPVKYLFFTIQKEVAERLAAKPNSKDYGPLSILCSVFAKVEILKKMPPELFWPKPKVSSSFVKLSTIKPLLKKDVFINFKKFVAALFGMRRKQLGTIIRKLDYKCDSIRFDCEERPGNLSPEELIDLFYSVAN